ncbi:MAG: polysaccharide deacetylase [Candidatus Gastranaerophilales bacterium]|nr:polysaccharide deacetylase [Candidatus Gastranaerophilales bacterium]
MSEIDYERAEYRRRRVRKLKRMIIWLKAMLFVMPSICCVILLVRMGRLNRQMENLGTQMESLNSHLEELVQLEVRQQENMETLISQEYESSVSIRQEVGAPELSEQAAEPDPVWDTVPELSQVHQVYLTFDDGPSVYTDKILDILSEYDVKATFFVVGKEDEASQAAIQRIVEEGHTLGMHSYSHKYASLYRSVDAFAEDFHKLQDYLYDLTGVKSVFYRFPGGSSNTVSPLNIRVFIDFLDAQGVTFYDWNIASGDGGSRLLDTDTLLYNSTNDISEWETSIILMHDSADKPTTVDALPAILDKILAMEDTVILPITADTEPVQHIHTTTIE